MCVYSHKVNTLKHFEEVPQLDGAIKIQTYGINIIVLDVLTEDY